MMAVATVDGEVNPAEVKRMVQIASAAGIPTEELSRRFRATQ